MQINRLTIVQLYHSANKRYRTFKITSYAIGILIVFLNIYLSIYLSICLFYLFMCFIVPGVELRALHLQGRHSTT
jgi:hypothetical protein